MAQLSSSLFILFVKSKQIFKTDILTIVISYTTSQLYPELYMAILVFFEEFDFEDFNFLRLRFVKSPINRLKIQPQHSAIAEAKVDGPIK